MDVPRFVFFCAMMALLGLLAYNSMIGANGWRRLVAIPILISPVAMVVIRYTYEGGQPAGILNPGIQSWAFLFGDPWLIPLALVAAAYAWPSDPKEAGWFNGKEWYFISLAGGYALAAFWNMVLDAPNYHRAGHGDLLLSPSHLWHGWVVFPVLSATLINYGVPVIIKWHRSKAAALFFVGLVGYIAMSVADATIHPLDVTNLHPPVGQTWLSDTK